MGHARRCETRIQVVAASQEDMASMVRPVVGGVPVGAPRDRRIVRGDLAMNVLQYGMAFVALAVVTLLAVAR
jgi:hypothetical protein